MNLMHHLRALCKEHPVQMVWREYPSLYLIFQLPQVLLISNKNDYMLALQSEWILTLSEPTLNILKHYSKRVDQQISNLEGVCS